MTYTSKADQLGIAFEEDPPAFGFYMTHMTIIRQDQDLMRVMRQFNDFYEMHNWLIEVTEYVRSMVEGKPEPADPERDAGIGRFG